LEEGGAEAFALPRLRPVVVERRVVALDDTVRGAGGLDQEAIRAGQGIVVMDVRVLNRQIERVALLIDLEIVLDAAADIDVVDQRARPAGEPVGAAGRTERDRGVVRSRAGADRSADRAVGQLDAVHTGPADSEMFEIVQVHVVERHFGRVVEIDANAPSSAAVGAGLVLNDAAASRSPGAGYVQAACGAGVVEADADARAAHGGSGGGGLGRPIRGGRRGGGGSGGGGGGGSGRGAPGPARDPC